MRVLSLILTVALICTLPYASAATAAAPATFAYGPAPLQNLDFWHAPASGPAPLIVFVHGGGWARGDKAGPAGLQHPGHWLDQGYAVAAINYRLVPGATVDQQAADVAASLAWLRAHAATMGIDPARVVLMGHSAGAQLAALVGTDPRYLTAAGMTLNDLRGVIALDGAAYDVPRQVAGAGLLMRRVYAAAFGADPARQRALSATLQAAAPNAPGFLFIHIDRDDSKSQAKELAAALTRAGTPAQVAAVDGAGLRGHIDLNTSLGNPDAPATAIIDAWLRQLPAQH